jgi:uncharacterized LabA/DUF88 family protein
MLGRTIWIVDAAYLMKAAPGRFDYVQLKKKLELEVGTTFAESFYLNSTSDPPSDQQDAFHTWLKMAPPKGPKMRVKLYKLKEVCTVCPGCSIESSRMVQRGVDVGIATLAVKMAAQGQYDNLLLSAGDGDFEDAIKFVREELHKQFWVAGFEGSVSADLQSYADQVVWLNETHIWDVVKKAG